MGRQRYVFNFKSARAVRAAGSKAARLHFLERHGFRVPATYVCTWEAYQQYLQGDPQLREALRAELAAVLDPQQVYAVRSSATVEDGMEYSFAGQFETILGVQGVENALRAIETVWASARSPEVQAYIHKHSGDPQALKMGVLIQEMVSPVVSGVVFSKDPLTGLDETIVEAVRGSGEALVQEGVTPHRWIYKGGEWKHRPQETDIPEEVIREVVHQTHRIARSCGWPVNLEWVYDGRAVTWVQLREITSLRAVDIYSNRISKEFFPGMIKPLVWSVNTPLVNGAWVWFLTEMVGPNDIDPNRLAKSFYYRAYFNMGVIGQIFELLGLPRDSIELLMGLQVDGDEKPSFRLTPRTLALLPRLLHFAWDKLHSSPKIAAFLPAAQAKYATLECCDIPKLSETALLAEFDRLYAITQEVAYYNIVASLLADLYAHLVRWHLKRLGVAFELFDLTEGMEGLEQFNPNPHLLRLSQAFRQLDEEVQARIRRDGYRVLGQLPEAQAFHAAVERFSEQFGHLRDSGNDFSSVPWREMPDIVLEMIINYPEPEEKTDQKVRFASLKLSPLQRWLLTPIYRRARAFRQYREAIASMNTFGYDLFRRCFLALGVHFVRRGLLEAREDIFCLDLAEIREIVAQSSEAKGCSDKVAQRKAEMEAYRDIKLPPIICGDRASPIYEDAGDSLKGVATSLGDYTGRVKVIRGIQDFPKVQEGDVLVIPYSDVGWTPLFAKAGAVVAESGGILSHSSIVAREYNIPAVVSVEGACQIPNGALVTVDGYQGTVKVHQPA